MIDEVDGKLLARMMPRLEDDGVDMLQECVCEREKERSFAWCLPRRVTIIIVNLHAACGGYPFDEETDVPLLCSTTMMHPKYYYLQ